MFLSIVNDDKGKHKNIINNPNLLGILQIFCWDTAI